MEADEVGLLLTTLLLHLRRDAQSTCRGSTGHASSFFSSPVVWSRYVVKSCVDMGAGMMVGFAMINAHVQYEKKREVQAVLLVPRDGRNPFHLLSKGLILVD